MKNHPIIVRSERHERWIAVGLASCALLTGCVENEGDLIADLDRAQRFYEALFATPLRRETMGPEELAVFPADEDGGVKGCLHLASTPVAPSDQGTRVYLDAGPSIDATLARVDACRDRLARVAPIVGSSAKPASSEPSTAPSVLAA